MLHYKFKMLMKNPVKLNPLNILSWNRTKFELQHCNTYTSFKPNARLVSCLLLIPEIKLPSLDFASSKISSVCKRILIGKSEESISTNFAYSLAARLLIFIEIK